MGLSPVESQPSSKLHFSTDFETPSQSRLTLNNTSGHSVLFKVKIKYPDCFVAHPAFGELLPGKVLDSFVLKRHLSSFLQNEIVSPLQKLDCFVIKKQLFS